MNKNSNTYIIGYSAFMVIVVAALLAYASLSLQKRQAENVRIEKMNDILRSIGKGGEADTAPDKSAYIIEEYGKYITESLAVDSKGGIVDGVDAFDLLINLKAEYDKPSAERRLPVFVSGEGVDRLYIFPVWGTGLWGPVWGYVALKSDLNTISGVVFDHKGETPGLGAEITTPVFTGQFKDKQVFDGDKIVGITVLKGDGASKGNDHAVDAISGGTITSRGVEAMIKNGLADYSAYILKQKSGQADATATGETEGEAADSLTIR